MAVIKLTKDNFESIAKGDKPVLIDFYATWCGPCKMVSPIIDEIAEEHPEYAVCKVNVDEEEALSSAFGISSIPTLVVIKNGVVTETSVGAKPKNAILGMLA